MSTERGPNYELRPKHGVDDPDYWRRRIATAHEKFNPALELKTSQTGLTNCLARIEHDKVAVNKELEKKGGSCLATNSE